MHLAEYRTKVGEVINLLHLAREASTSHQQRLACQRLRDGWKELSRLACPMMTGGDLDRVDTLERDIRVFLEIKQREFDQADSLIIELAYAKDYVGRLSR